MEKMVLLAPRGERISSGGVIVGGGERRQRWREWESRHALKCIISSLFPLFIFLHPASAELGEKERQGPYYDRFCRFVVVENMVMYKEPLPLLWQRRPPPYPNAPPVAGY